MDAQLLAGVTTALWLGILASISPCPLATNIAAVSFIGKQFSSTPRVVLSGLAYVGGRMLAYVALGMALVGGLLSAPSLSMFLQRYMNQVLGPALILTGMVLLELLRIGFRSRGVTPRMQARAERGGVLGAGFLGIVFALSFCPVTAALFFGTLVPLSIRHQAPVTMPLLFGIGTGLPVLVFAGMIAAGARSVGTFYKHLSRIELWARRMTGGLFIAAGIYLTLRYVFELF